MRLIRFHVPTLAERDTGTLGRQRNLKYDNWTVVLCSVTTIGTDTEPGSNQFLPLKFFSKVSSAASCLHWSQETDGGDEAQEDQPGTVVCYLVTNRTTTTTTTTTGTTFFPRGVWAWYLLLTSTLSQTLLAQRYTAQARPALYGQQTGSTDHTVRLSQCPDI